MEPPPYNSCLINKICSIKKELSILRKSVKPGKKRSITFLQNELKRIIYTLNKEITPIIRNPDENEQNYFSAIDDFREELSNNEINIEET